VGGGGGGKKSSPQKDILRMITTEIPYILNTPQHS
jgi:hypothetical protein